MNLRLTKITLFAVAALLLAACAPADLDMTPTIVVPATLLPGQDTPTPAPAATEANVADQALLEYLVAHFPTAINAGSTNWHQTKDENPPKLQFEYGTAPGGVTVKMFYSEAGGGYSELTFGSFDSPDSAQAYYDVVKGRTRNLEHAQQRDRFPQPNLFGSGTYGSDAIFLEGDVYVRISVPRFSGAGNQEPLSPYARALFQILDPLLAAFGQATAEATSAEVTAAAEVTATVAPATTVAPTTVAPATTVAPTTAAPTTVPPTAAPTAQTTATAEATTAGS